MRRTWGVSILGLILGVGPGVMAASYHSPDMLAFSPDGRTLAVGDATQQSLHVLDPATAGPGRSVKLNGPASGVAWSADGSLLYAAEVGASSIAVVDPLQGKVRQRFEVGRYPRGVAVVAERGWLLVADSGQDRLSILHLDHGKLLGQVPTGCQPRQVAVSPDASLAVVSNLLPATAATDPQHAADVTIVDLAAMRAVASVRLPPGSTNARGVAFTPDGRHAFVAHTLGRFHLPTTQLDRGWVITNALSVIDLGQRKLKATVLLDQPTDGAADPWGVAVDPRGESIYITLSGVHQLAILDMAGLLELIDRSDPTTLTNDLSMLHRRGLLRRLDLPLNGPRGLAVSPDGERLAVSGYFSGNLAISDRGADTIRSISLGDQPAPDAVRHGEIAYHDASGCFQRWLSCASCHPSARADGLNWDLLNDGIGNPKNARSMLLSHRTPPMTSLGVREQMEMSVRAGFLHIQFVEPDPADEQAVIAYLKSLKPAVSPHRKRDGSLTESATRGREIFNRPVVGCADCHPAPLFTHLQLVDVGTSGPLDQGATDFDTPTLRELWRTPPYLHDGRSATLQEVLVHQNKDDQHGNTSILSRGEIDDLIQYLLSL